MVFVRYLLDDLVDGERFLCKDGNLGFLGLNNAQL